MVDDERCVSVWLGRLAKQEGLFCGGSCGGALQIALDIAAEHDKVEKRRKSLSFYPMLGIHILEKSTTMTG